jgi:hypothetical protein
MRNLHNTKHLGEITSKNHIIQEFYDPLTPNQLVKKKKIIPSKNSSCFRTLFGDNENQENIPQENSIN